MIEVMFRPIQEWPGVLLDETEREYPRFTAPWGDTKDVLFRELRQLDAEDVVVELDVKPSSVRVDGQLRADTKVGHPGVILSFDSKHGPLRYWTDLYKGRTLYGGRGSKHMPGWQMNLRGIALGLEALRKVERYGVTHRGEQYTGWSALPPATPMGAAMFSSLEDAAAFLIEAGGGNPEIAAAYMAGTRKPDDIDGYYRLAAKALHPDAGGDEESFKKLQAAVEMLRAA